MKGRTKIATGMALAALALAGCGGSDSSSSSSDDFSFSGEDEQHWIDTWCDLDVGMTRDEVIAEMGEPTLEFEADSGSQPQSQWDGGQTSFTVFYDSTGQVEQLYINPLEIDAEVDSQIACPLTRT